MGKNQQWSLRRRFKEGGREGKKERVKDRKKEYNVLNVLGRYQVRKLF